MEKIIKVQDAPIADANLMVWLVKRREKLQKEHDNAENLDVKKSKGARLKQIKEILNYVYTHKT
jgi:hypothetical protein